MQRTGVLVVVAVVALVLTGGVGATVPPGTSAHAATTSQQACDFPVEVEDGGGQTVTVEQEPEEVVVLAASNAQHMWEIGAEDKVTGLPAPFTGYLDGSEERTNVVNDQGLAVAEEVIALEPDLVLAADITSDETIQQLRDAGLTVYQSPLMTSVEDMYTEVETVGQLVGQCEQASETVEQTRQQITEIENAVAGEDSPTVYYNLGFPFTVGDGTLEHQLITKAGGENIALEADSSGYFEINEEIIAANDPEWIVTPENIPLPDVTAIQESTAVQEDQIIRVNPNYISQHGPRNTIPLETMAESFHPEVMAQLDATPTPTPTPAPTATPTPESTATPQSTPTATPDETTPTATDEAEESDGSGPGFVIGSALAALLVVVVVARYRAQT